jgi:hypothetical protein
MRQLVRPLLVDNLFDDGHREFGEYRQRGISDVELAFSEFLGNQFSLAFERNKHVTDLALHEGRHRVAAARGKERRILEQSAYEVLRFLLIAARLPERIAPGGEVGIAAIAGVFRVRQNDLDSRLDEVRPVVQRLGVTLAHDEHHGRGIWRRCLESASRNR